MITREDLEVIKEELDDRYVLQSDCDSTQRDISKKFANDDKRIDKLIDRMEIWNKLFWVIASSSIGALIVSLAELILK